MPTLVEFATEKSADYSKLSPFELKDLLIGMADEAAKTRAAVMLNAGRGNPNAPPEGEEDKPGAAKPKPPAR